MSDAGAEGLVEELRGEIASLHDALIGAEWHGDEAARQRDVWKHRAETAEAALEAQSRALAEARAEIERLTKLPVIADYIEVQTRAREAMDELCKFADFKNCTAADVYRARELTGLLHLNAQDNFASLSTENTRKNVSEDGKHVSISQEQHANDESRIAERQRDEALEALRPFASADRALGSIPGSDGTFRLETNTGYREIHRDAFRRARSVLENGPARLADANSKESLSQDQEIAGLREDLRRKEEALHACHSFLSKQTPNNDALLDMIDAALAREEA